jgi:hypothetical protein
MVRSGGSRRDPYEGCRIAVRNSGRRCWTGRRRPRSCTPHTGRKAWTEVRLQLHTLWLLRTGRNERAVAQLVGVHESMVLQWVT